jgi:hypothetical protein
MLNPFSDEEVQEVTIENQPPVYNPNQNSLETELDEIEKLTGSRPKVVTAENFTEAVDNQIEEIQEEVEPIFTEPLLEENIAEERDFDKEDALVEDIAQDNISVKKPTPPSQEIAEEPINIETKTVQEPSPVEPVTAPQTESAQPNKTGCPQIMIVPAARSMTHFVEGSTTSVKSRAVISDIRGGCEIVDGGMEVDLDILMRGTITRQGRFEQDSKNETFVTFPYFVTTMTPYGNIKDKDIMATAIRFRPNVDFIEHAEKITQFVPMSDINNSGSYTMNVGFQLSRQQLDYNRLLNTQRPDNNRASPDTSPAQRRSYNPLADE